MNTTPKVDSEMYEEQVKLADSYIRYFGGIPKHAALDLRWFCMTSYEVDNQFSEVPVYVDTNCETVRPPSRAQEIPNEQ